MQNNADIAAKQKGGTARTAIKRAFFMRTIAHIECHWDIVYALLVQQPDNQLIAKWKSAILALIWYLCACDTPF